MSYWAKQREAAWKAKHDGAGTAQPSALAVAASARPANPQQARLAAAFHKLNGDDQGFAQMEAAYQKENGVPSAPPPQLAQEHAREGAPRYERHEAPAARYARRDEFDDERVRRREETGGFREREAAPRRESERGLPQGRSEWAPPPPPLPPVLTGHVSSLLPY